MTSPSRKISDAAERALVNANEHGGDMRAYCERIFGGELTDGDLERLSMFCYATYAIALQSLGESTEEKLAALLAVGVACMDIGKEIGKEEEAEFYKSIGGYNDV